MATSATVRGSSSSAHSVRRMRTGFPSRSTFMEYYGAHLLDATRAYPGILEALDALRARAVTLSVLTNKPVAMSRAILDGLQLADRFVDVVGGDSLPVRKPDPGGVDYLRRRSGTTLD